MRKILAMAAWIGLGLVAFVPAQAQVRHDIATERAQIQSDRQAIVAQNLPLSERQARAFWPMYREYRGELARLGDRLVELLLDYAKNEEALTDSQAARLLDESLRLQREEIRIKLAWVPKYRRVLPPKAVTRFYQIENKLDAILRYDAVDEIPLVVNEPES